MKKVGKWILLTLAGVALSLLYAHLTKPTLETVLVCLGLYFYLVGFMSFLTRLFK